MSLLKTHPGLARPYGVDHTHLGHNFSLFAGKAHQVTLEVHLPERHEPLIIPLDPQVNRTGQVWHITLEGLPQSFSYGYRLEGPYDPAQGQLYDPKHLLVDPFARCLSGLETWGQRSQPPRPLLAKFEEAPYDWQGDRPLNIPLHQTIIYELQVRAFTRHASSGVQSPGTYAGLIEKIGYLKELGITSVELLPIHEFDETDCPFFHPVTGQRLLNLWGYNNINFFSVKAGFAQASGAKAANEFRDLVKALHRAGIEVILDVVFNHTAEGGTQGKVINFKGLSNETYYLLDENKEYRNYSGCGNTMNCNHPIVRKMIMESLRYWVDEMHIDGFRFDLASILGRDKDGKVLPHPPLLESIAKDPVLAGTKIIAEAWDATGLYQVGSFPASGRWAEWNGKFRDVVRRFARGEKHLIGELATRIAGSEDLYGHSQRNPYHSINFITAHDGFTMMDLVSYMQKHNLDNGEDNRDGGDYNFSINFGIEGPTPNPRIQRQRIKQIRNLACLLLLSQGTPMILAGDEFGRSQKGNNNAWCQDNELSWVDWDLLQKHQDLFLFWKALIAFRKSHPHLNRRAFFTGQINPHSGLADLTWHDQRPLQPEFEHQKASLAMLIDGMQGDQVVDDCIYVAMNFESHRRRYELPTIKSSQPWRLVLSTAQPEFFIQGQEQSLSPGQTWVELEEFSLVVLCRAYG